MANAVSISKLSKSYFSGAAANRVLDGLELSVPTARITSVVGPSGSGKTTMLNLVAKLDLPDVGSIVLAVDSRVGYMMQDALLLPWRTLYQNASLGVEVIEGRTRTSDKELRDYFRIFDLADATGVYPEAASGGMKQRVALIRVLLTTPTVLLLDEPFSGLDFDVKLKIQRFLLNYHEKNGTTILLVTHDIEDAIALSDEVVVLSDKPATVKAIIPIDLGLGKHDPIEARKSPRFTEYFTRIWDEIKYLDEE